MDRATRHMNSMYGNMIRSSDAVKLAVPWFDRTSIPWNTRTATTPRLRTLDSIMRSFSRKPWQALSLGVFLASRVVTRQKVRLPAVEEKGVRAPYPVPDWKLPQGDHHGRATTTIFPAERYLWDRE